MIFVFIIFLILDMLHMILGDMYRTFLIHIKKSLMMGGWGVGQGTKDGWGGSLPLGTLAISNAFIPFRGIHPCFRRKVEIVRPSLEFFPSNIKSSCFSLIVFIEDNNCFK